MSDDEQPLQEALVAKDMYDQLKRLWMLEAKWVDEEDQPEHEAKFDAFVSFMSRTQERSEQHAHEHQHKHVEQPSLSAQLMEFILEIDETLPMVPPRVATYRQLLVDAGLDRQPVRPDDDDTPAYGASGGGMQGMPGITLADQAALAFHQHLLQMALTIAQDAANDKLRRQLEAQQKEIDDAQA